MSHHYFKTHYLGRPAVVLLGWDISRLHFFLVVKVEVDEENEVDAYDVEADDSSIVYSYLWEQDAFNCDLAFFRTKLKTLGIWVPESMFHETSWDRALGLIDRKCWHEIGGMMSEVAQ